MLKNYFKTGIRNLRKNRSASVINVLGLAIGMACCLMIVLYIQDEWSYDRYHTKADRIVRVVKDFVDPDGGRVPDATTPPGLAPAAVAEIPEVQRSVRLFTSWGGRALIEIGEEQFYETDFVFVDSTFFKVFDFEVLSGRLDQSLRAPDGMVLTESKALKYYGEVDVAGRELTMDGRVYIVEAVVTDVPRHSHYHFDLFLPMTRLGNFDQDWDWYNFYTYLLLKKDTDRQALDAKLQALYRRNNPDGLNEFYAQPLTDIHLRSDLRWELGTGNGDIRYIFIFSAVALLVLLIAGANYVNLATARSASRAREVGIRKVSGAQRSALIGQFLAESLLIAWIAGVLSVVLVELWLPSFNHLVDKQIELLAPANVGLFMGLAGAVSFFGLLAGSYPAFYLSAFKPVKVLRSYSPGSRQSGWLRRALVVGQFAIAASLIAGVFIVFHQMQYIQSKDLGFEEERLVMLPSLGSLETLQPLTEELSKVPLVHSAGGASAVLGGLNWTRRMARKGRLLEEGILVNYAYVDYEFLATVGFETRAGRMFSRSFPGDTLDAIVLNETAAQTLGLAPPYVGQEVVSGDQGASLARRVAGVVSDFHFSSLREPIKPYAFILQPRYANNLYVRLVTDDYQRGLAEIRKAWDRAIPDYPFTYEIIDDNFRDLHRGDRQFGTVLFVFSLLAVFIACLGLLALVAFTTEQRIKEIGIRKVLGASVSHIVLILSREFLWLVLTGLLIGLPLAWYAMLQWLNHFAYHSSINWRVFAFSAALVTLVAFATMSWHAIRAALSNPVTALKYE